MILDIYVKDNKTHVFITFFQDFFSCNFIILKKLLEMKKQILLPFFFITSFIYSQINEVKLHDFLLTDSELRWQHAYKSDLKANDLKNHWMNFILSLKNIENLTQSGNMIIFDLKNDKIDYRKSGSSWNNTADIVKYPQNYRVEIDIQDYQYNVSIQNIKALFRNTMRIADFSGPWQSTNLVDIVTRKRSSEFRKSKAMSKGMNSLHQYYLNKFDSKK